MQLYWSTNDHSFIYILFLYDYFYNSSINSLLWLYIILLYSKLQIQTPNLNKRAGLPSCLFYPVLLYPTSTDYSLHLLHLTPWQLDNGITPNLPPTFSYSTPNSTLVLPRERVDKQRHHDTGYEDAGQIDGADGEDLGVRRPLDVGVSSQVGAEVGPTVSQGRFGVDGGIAVRHPTVGSGRENWRGNTKKELATVM